MEQDPPVYRSKYTQFYLYFGGPLPGYNTVLDNEDEQNEKVTDWSEQYLDMLEAVSPRTFRENHYSDGFSGLEIARLI